MSKTKRFDPDSKSRLLNAIYENKPEVLSAMKNEGYPITTHRFDKDGSTALHIAAGDEDIQPRTIQKLLNLGLNPNARDTYGKTPLHIASEQEHMKPKIIKTLIEAGSDPRATDKNGVTPIGLAEMTTYDNNNEHRQEIFKALGSPDLAYTKTQRDMQKHFGTTDAAKACEIYLQEKQGAEEFHNKVEKGAQIQDDDSCCIIMTAIIPDQSKIYLNLEQEKQSNQMLYRHQTELLYEEYNIINSFISHPIISGPSMSDSFGIMIVPSALDPFTLEDLGQFIGAIQNYFTGTEDNS